MSDEAFQSLMDFSKAMKKVPIVCKVGVACCHGDSDPVLHTGHSWLCCEQTVSSLYGRGCPTI